MKSQYKVTPRARQDLKKIGRYTLRNWGKQQRDKYLFELINRFQWLSENPRLGIIRPDIKKGYYCFPHGNHLIFYLIYDDHIEIIGVPHQQMDIFKYFNR